MPQSNQPIRRLAQAGATLAALVLAQAGGLAQAAEQTFTLQGLTDSGPLSPLAFSGQFAYDAGAAAGSFTGELALSQFVLDFAGARFTLATADATPLAVFANGVFMGLDYVDADSPDLSARPNLALVSGLSGPDDAYLAYETDGSPGPAGGFGSYSVNAAPEPTALGLALAALGLLAVVRTGGAASRSRSRRRRQR